MMSHIIRLTGPILAAFSLSGIIYWLLKTVRIERGASRQLLDFQGDSALCGHAAMSLARRWPKSCPFLLTPGRIICAGRSVEGNIRVGE